MLDNLVLNTFRNKVFVINLHQLEQARGIRTQTQQTIHLL
jgi:hypothetical protein